ncbi:MAG: MFS transporter [Anaerolineae bacterium]|nr:MFS transporter [Anaerolineae bacterium]
MHKPSRHGSWQRTLYAVLFAQFVSAVGFSSVFPFLSLYVQELGTNTGLSVEFWAGMAFSSQAFTMMIAAPIWGAVADRYGRKLMIERAMFGGAVLLFCMGLVRSAEGLALLRAVQGLVTGVVSAANALVAAVAPRERSGYALGALQMGFWCGTALGPLIGGFIADTWGYQAAFYVTGVLLAVAGFVIWLGIPEVRGMGAQGGARAFMREWWKILSLPGIGLTYGARSLTWLARTMLAPIMPLFVQALIPHSPHLNTYTGLMVGVASATGTVSAIYLGRLGDRIGHRRVLVTSAVAAGVFYLAQSFVTQAWHLLVLQALAGVSIGGIVPSVSALLNGYSQPGKEGAVYGLDSSVQAAARTVAPLAGTAVASWVGLQAPFAVAGFLFFVTAALVARWLPGSRPQVVGQPEVF